MLVDFFRFNPRNKDSRIDYETLNEGNINETLACTWNKT